MESLRLVACIRLSLEEELLVENGILPERFEGHKSGDQQVGPVKDFLESRKLPWSETFVSVFVLLPEDDTTWLHEAFGYPFELKLDQIPSAYPSNSGLPSPPTKLDLAPEWPSGRDQCRPDFCRVQQRRRASAC